MTNNEDLNGPSGEILDTPGEDHTPIPPVEPVAEPTPPVKDKSKHATPEDAAGATRKNTRLASHLKNSPFAKAIGLSGSNNSYHEIGNINIYEGPERVSSRDCAPGDRQKRSLFDIASPLETPSSRRSRLSLDEHHTYLKELWESRLVLVNSADEEICHQAGQELIDGLGFPDAHKRLLDLGREDDEINSIDLTSLLKKTTESEQRTGVLISVFRDVTRTFLDSLFSVAGESATKTLLKANDLYLVCVAEPERVRMKAEAHSQDFRFSLWGISFLRPLLLKSGFEECESLERVILGQRKRGLWNKDEVKFALEIRRAINSGELVDKVRSLEASPITITLPDVPFKGTDPVRDTVVFTAAYFPNLTPINFIRVVEALLGERTKPVNSLTPRAPEAAVAPDAPKEIPLAEIWRDTADEILDQCQLEIVSGRDTTRIVEFRDQRMRERVERHLESRYRFYLEKQAKRIRQTALIFDPSTGISDGAIQFILGRAALSPDDFDKDWLVDIVSGLERRTRTSVFPDPGPTGGSSSFEPYGHTKGRAYTRVAELLRAMLEDRRLSDKVNGVLERLMVARLYGGVLQITRRLHFAPNFDDFYWMKQLFERGDLQCRDEAFGYLLTYLKRLESNIYEKLAVLKTWLPEEGYDQLPQASRSALELVMHYCEQTTLFFPSEYYGAWPSRFPIFAVNDKSDFEPNAKLLAEWLFHPAMREVESSSLIGLVIAIWVFILRGPPDKASEKARAPARRKQPLQEQDATGSNSTPYPAAVLKLLLQQVASAATAEDRRTLIRDWQQMIDYMFDWIEALQSNNPLRKDLLWQRNQTRDLIRSFKEISKGVSRKPRAAAHPGSQPC